MTDIEQKALELVNDTFRERYYKDWSQVPQGCLSEALCRAIEQHEAFRQEVSDALSVYQKADGVEERSRIWDALTRFILPKPDPLVEAMEEASGTNDPVEWANRFYAAIEKRGGKITWGEG